MNENLHKVIGIDLGTTFSAVAAYDSYLEQTEIIRNKFEEDSETTPSVVSIDSNTKKVFAGFAAKRNLPVKPENTIIEIKREMGEEFNEQLLEKFNARNVYREKDAVKVEFCGEWRLPQEISAFILMHLKEIAEKEIGGEILDAVVTVPAYFSEKQRKATEEAALLAGLYPRQLIPEPTAAAICYGVDKMESEKKTYLVYDLGGGTFDVSIIEVEEGKISVIATSGDPRLGGGDFDDAITKWAVDVLLNEYKLDVRNDRRVQALIKERAEVAKINLGNNTETTLELMFLDSQKVPGLKITREKFQELIEPLLGKSLSYVKEAIKIAETTKGFDRESLDAILLVGGSTKIPRVKEMLLDDFGKDEQFVRSELNPDTVVARGAAIMAHRFEPSEPPFDIKKKDECTLENKAVADEIQVNLITEYSLGVEVRGDLVDKIIDQGTGIPVRKEGRQYGNSGPSEFISVNVYQGEGKYTYENTLIGTLQIGPMTPQPAGFHNFEVVFELDKNGLLSMTINHINEDKSYKAKFDQITGVGGEDRLIPLRAKLLELYSSAVAVVPPPVKEEVIVVPPPAGGVETPKDSTAPAANVAAPVETETVPDRQEELPPREQRPQPDSPVAQPVATAPAAQKVTPPTPRPEAADMGAVPKPAPPVERKDGNMIEPGVEVPAQYKQVVRRTKKQLLKVYDPVLLKAYNDFINLLNSGYTEEQLEEPGDELADVYETRKHMQPTIFEADIDVPDQFKQLIRRVKKHLLKDMEPVLLDNYNMFINSLNSGTNEEELEEIGDQLADAFDEARK